MQPGNKKWYSSTWLDLENYLYIEINKIIRSKEGLESFDVFLEQKIKAENGLDFMNLDKNLEKYSLETLLSASLWGNKCDLSLSNGEVIPQNDDDPNVTTRFLEKNLIINKRNTLVSWLGEARKIAMILDNCGKEFQADIRLAHYLTDVMGKSVTLFPKAIPWYVSDVLMSDIERLDIRIDCFEDEFWTTQAPYHKIKGKLLNKLNQYDVILFKGDLNYRKLLGDLDWPKTITFQKVLQQLEFPVKSKIATLRTCKAEITVGLSKNFQKPDPTWEISGDYGIIDVADLANKSSKLILE